MSKLQKIETDLKTLDIASLATYDERISSMVLGTNPLKAPMYMRDFVEAYDATNSMLAKATRALGKAQGELEMYESIAYFDKAPDFLSQRGVKDTVEARKQYVPLNVEVQEAKDIVALAESVVGFLRNKLITYRMAHDDVKKAAYTQDNSPDGQ